jgi:flagellin
MRINTNIASMNAQQLSSNTQKEIGSSLEKLASGHSINKASDDAAGLAIADKLRTQASSINQGIKNANSGVAMIQMADKAMEEQSNILNTVKTKLIQASNDTVSIEGRAAIQSDITALLTQFDNIASQTDYNGQNLLNSAQTLNFQVGESNGESISMTTSKASNTSALGGNTGTGTHEKDLLTITEGDTAGDVVAVTVNGTDFSVTKGDVVNGITVSDKATMTDALAFKINAGNTGSQALSDGTDKLTITSNSVGVDTQAVSATQNTVTLTHTNTAGTAATNSLEAIMNNTTLTAANAQTYMSSIDTALTELNTNRSAMGSAQLQLESSVRNNQVTVVSLNEAESVIRDTDYAAESANFNKLNIISQAGMYAISQANASQQNVMKLLQ